MFQLCIQCGPQPATTGPLASTFFSIQTIQSIVPCHFTFRTNDVDDSLHTLTENETVSVTQ